MAERNFPAGTRFWDCEGVPVTSVESNNPPGFVEVLAWDRKKPRPFGLTTLEDDGVEIDEAAFRAVVMCSASSKEARR